MTIEEILYQIETVPEIVGWFLSVRESENITSNHHGKNIEEFKRLVREADKNSDPEGNVPIIHFVFFHDGHANSFMENKLWNALDYETYDSHLHANVPYIGEDGEFYNFSLLEIKRKNIYN